MRKKVISLFMLGAVLLQMLVPSTCVFAENDISDSKYITDFSVYVDGEKVKDGQTVDYYASIKLEYKLEFPDDLAINDGDTITLPIPRALIQKNSLQFPIKSPEGIEIGTAVAKNGEIKITFNDYFKNHPENKYMNVELWSEWNKEIVGNGDWVDLEIGEFKLHVQAGTGVIGDPEDYIKWGNFNEDHTEIEWTIKLNEKFDDWENVTLTDTIGPDQELIEDSIEGLILESFDDYTQHENLTPDMITVKEDKTGFTVNLGNKLNKHGLLLTYRVRVKNLEEGKKYTNSFELAFSGKNEKCEAETQYLSGGGSGGGTDHAEAVLKAKKVLDGRPLKDSEFEFVLEEIENSNNIKEIQRKKNDSNGDVIFDKIEYRSEGTFNYQIREVKGNLQNVTYDEKIAKVQVKVEVRDNRWYADIVYIDSQTPPTFKNKYDEPKTEIKVTKAWEDKNDQDGKRPGSVTVRLLADGEEVPGKALTLTKGNNWTGSFTDLDEYKEGKKIEYTIKEEPVGNGYVSVVTGTAEEGYKVTNTREPEKVDVEGKKTWNDKDNQDGKRPEAIVINLLKNGQKVDSKTVKKVDGWKWKFEGLDKYENGEEIIYTITEERVEGYSTEVTGYDVKNSYTPGKVSIQVTKAWEDENDQDGKRPGSVTVRLLADGEEVPGKALTLTKGNNWTGSFTDLDEYKEGKKIEYTIKEEPVGNGYVSVVTGTAEKGYVITNVRTPDTPPGKSNKNLPKTGDGANPTLYVSLLGLSGAALLLFEVLRRKKREQDDF